MPDSLLQLGRIIGVHGLNGTIQIHSDTRPAIGIAGYSRWWVGAHAMAAKPVRVCRCWAHGKRILAQLEGVAHIEAAEALRGQLIFIQRTQVPVGEDEYLWQDLVGCAVVDVELGPIGRVVALTDYGAQDILIVRGDAHSVREGEWMIPFTSQIIRDVDLKTAQITVALPEGMDACFTPN
ncbi:MAG: 16S rRNA processing protein RimM [Zetaproteobacteria bacterium]|nr:MAG: 16S rRNA processing protein RimM [Zetaproteobacteria bacterium]